MTTTESDWQARARRLAERLADDGVLDDPLWREAVESVPRHVFVPRFYVQQPNGDWRETTAESDGWLDAVYEDAPLVTALAATPSGSRATLTSSTKPALMLRILSLCQPGGWTGQVVCGGA
jgi:protein-L-isoaspartate O-methyltransferase